MIWNLVRKLFRKSEGKQVGKTFYIPGNIGKGIYKNSPKNKSMPLVEQEARAFWNRVERRRKRNKIARKSRRISRLRMA